MLINLRDKNGKLVIKDILDIDFNMCVVEEAGEYVVQINSTYNYAQISLLRGRQKIRC